MTQLILTSWDTAIDLIVIGLCGVIILMLIYNQIKYRKLMLSAPRQDPATEFSHEVTKRMICQRFEKSLAAILTTIESERQMLQKWYEDGDAAVGGIPIPTRMDPGSGVLGDKAEHHTDIEVARVKMETARAAHMAACGTPIDDICDDLMLPRECVELIVHMNSAKKLHHTSLVLDDVASG